MFVITNILQTAGVFMLSYLITVSYFVATRFVLWETHMHIFLNKTLLALFKQVLVDYSSNRVWSKISSHKYVLGNREIKSADLAEENCRSSKPCCTIVIFYFSYLIFKMYFKIFFFPTSLDPSLMYELWALLQWSAWSILLSYEVTCPCMVLKFFQFTTHLT